MSHSYQQTKELYYTRVRVPKDDAYFVYFTFEANEGLCFYSTVDESLRGQYRDIDVKCAVEWRETLISLLERLKTEMRLDVIDSGIIFDS
jgi:hypothetical protein